MGDFIPLKIFILTWNMGNAPAKVLTRFICSFELLNYCLPQGLDDVLRSKCRSISANSALDDSKYDLVCLGLQESTYRNKNVENPTHGDCIAELSEYISSALGPSYILVCI